MCLVVRKDNIGEVHLNTVSQDLSLKKCNLFTVLNFYVSLFIEECVQKPFVPCPNKTKICEVVF